MYKDLGSYTFALPYYKVYIVKVRCICSNLAQQYLGIAIGPFWRINEASTNGIVRNGNVSLSLTHSFVQTLGMLLCT